MSPDKTLFIKARRGSHLTYATQVREERGHGLLTAFILWTLDQDLKLESKDSWALGILVTALQGEVEVPSHVSWLLVLQPEHLRVGGGSWDIVLNTLLLPLTVGDVEVKEGDAGP